MSNADLIIGFEAEPGDRPPLALQEHAIHHHLGAIGPTAWLLLVALSEGLERTDHGRGITTVGSMASWLGVPVDKVTQALRRLHRFGFVITTVEPTGIDVCILRERRSTRRLASA